MPTKRVNYSKVRDKKRTATEKKPERTPIGEEPKRYVFEKKIECRIRIRKGPGDNFEHNGRYIDKQKRVEIVEIQGDWGLLKSYKDTRDGWICLTFLTPFDSIE